MMPAVGLSLVEKLQLLAAGVDPDAEARKERQRKREIWAAEAKERAKARAIAAAARAKERAKAERRKPVIRPGMQFQSLVTERQTVPGYWVCACSFCGARRVYFASQLLRRKRSTCPVCKPLPRSVSPKAPKPTKPPPPVKPPAPRFSKYRIGDRFGKLRVEARSKSDGKNLALFCSCGVCGSLRWYFASCLKVRKNPTCGCRPVAHGRARLDRIGQRFGELTVIENGASSKEKETLRCGACNKTTKIFLINLVRRKNSTCGCRAVTPVKTRKKARKR